MPLFKSNQFKQDIITGFTGNCLRYNLSYRNVSEILREHEVYFSTRRFTDEYKNTVMSFTLFEKYH